MVTHGRGKVEMLSGLRECSSEGTACLAPESGRANCVADTSSEYI